MVINHPSPDAPNTIRELDLDAKSRAHLSGGSSSQAIYSMVEKAIASHHQGRGLLVDVGCGGGRLWPCVKQQFDQYIGADIVRYESFPETERFVEINLDENRVPLPDACADVVVSVETIEHLENPRALLRELVRLVKPGGWAMITTPNQLSLLSKLTLIFKNQFNAFQDAPGLYPAHITALLEIDLRRIFQECGLTNINIAHSNYGRIPFTPWHYPQSLGFQGRNFSDNILCMGQKTEAT